MFLQIRLGKPANAPVHYAPGVGKHEQRFWAVPSAPCVHKHVSNSCGFAFLAIIAFVQPQVLTPRWPRAPLSLMLSTVWLLKSSLFYMVFVLLCFLSFSPFLHVVDPLLLIEPPCQIRQTCIEEAVGRIPFSIHPGVMKVVQGHLLALREVKRGKGKADEMIRNGIPPPGQNN